MARQLGGIVVPVLGDVGCFFLGQVFIDDPADKMGRATHAMSVQRDHGAIGRGNLPGRQYIAGCPDILLALEGDLLDAIIFGVARFEGHRIQRWVLGGRGKTSQQLDQFCTQLLVPGSPLLDRARAKRKAPGRRLVETPQRRKRSVFRGHRHYLFTLSHKCYHKPP